ncbi:MAG: PEP-CTERM sorting domain-containing protein [Phycisphaerales bacterium]|nr:PEP-CTERM sorting domain-containing protein [Phycisphaerales bacterium]
MKLSTALAATGFLVAATFASGATFQTILTEIDQNTPLQGGYNLALSNNGPIAFVDDGKLYYYNRVNPPVLVATDAQIHSISLSGSSLLTYQSWDNTKGIKQWDGSTITQLSDLNLAPASAPYSVNSSGQVAWNHKAANGSPGTDELHQYQPGTGELAVTYYTEWNELSSAGTALAPNGTAYYIDFDDPTSTIKSAAPNAGSLPTPGIRPTRLLGANNNLVLFAADDYQGNDPLGTYLVDRNNNAVTQLSANYDTFGGDVTPGGRVAIADQNLTLELYDITYYDGSQTKHFSDIYADDFSLFQTDYTAPMINDNAAGMVVFPAYIDGVPTLFAWDTLHDSYSILAQEGQMIQVSDSLDPVEVLYLNLNQGNGGLYNDGFSENNELVFSFMDTDGITRIVSTVVPEPSLSALLVIGAAALLGRRRQSIN